MDVGARPALSGDVGPSQDPVAFARLDCALDDATDVLFNMPQPALAAYLP